MSSYNPTSFPGGSFIDALGTTIGDAISNFALLAGSGQRQIGGIFPNVVIGEEHSDRLIVTEHPVEKGTPVSDHSYMPPKQVTMICGWSNSSVGDESYIGQIYRALLDLQKSRKPFALTTGKRTYPSMLITELAQRTGPDSENALMISITLRELITTSTQSTSEAASGAASSDPANQSDPAKTASTQDTGSREGLTADGVPTFANSTSIDWQTPYDPNAAAAVSGSPYGDLSGTGSLSGGGSSVGSDEGPPPLTIHGGSSFGDRAAAANIVP